jgi:predicted GNAT family acetyltransferase
MNVAARNSRPSPPGFGPATVQACVRGFVSAVEYHFSWQGDAKIRHFGSVTTLEHRDEIEHPWPRAFRFKLELLVEEGATAAEITNLYRHLACDPHVECVANLLVSEPDALVEDLKSSGFTRAFDKALMARCIGVSELSSERPERIDVRKVDTPALVAQTARLGQEYRSHNAVLGDRQLHDFVVFRDQAVVATAQLVTTNYGVAYVSRMFTAPEHRQTGCCRALLNIMHAEARALGMTHSVLVPSRMAWELGVYQQLGYRNCNTIALIVRERSWRS